MTRKEAFVGYLDGTFMLLSFLTGLFFFFTFKKLSKLKRKRFSPPCDILGGDADRSGNRGLFSADFHIVEFCSEIQTK